MRCHRKGIGLKLFVMRMQRKMGTFPVARHVGFDDPYHFSRRFKQNVGVAPTAYMESPQLRVAALDGLGHCLALGVIPVAIDGAAIGGWLTAKAHHLAVDKVSEDSDFFLAKQQIARFYASNVLPEAQTYAHIVKSGATGIIEADPARM